MQGGKTSYPENRQQTTLQLLGKVTIKVCSLDPVTQTSAPIPDLDSFQLLRFVPPYQTLTLSNYCILFL